jgi:protein-L-isoaspartate(D-aspartate) O-methyltransferase
LFQGQRMDFELARHHMVESQVRPSGITDPLVIAAMAAVPRELFIPPQIRWLAYADQDVELASIGGSRRFLLRPMNFARMAQLLALRPEENVLDVGCGSGYSCAVLAQLGKTVIGVETDAQLAGQAQNVLGRLGINSASVVVAELSSGHMAGAPYDTILINGRSAEPPLALLGQLKEHGRLTVIVGDEEVARIALFTRNGAFSVRYAFDAVATILPGFEGAKPSFSF